MKVKSDEQVEIECRCSNESLSSQSSKERRYSWMNASGQIVSRKLTNYECQLEDDVQKLQDALFSISSHYAKIQFRLRQIATASGYERICLLRELERVTCQGIDDNRLDDELPNMLCDSQSLGNVRVKQQKIIAELRGRLRNLADVPDLCYCAESDSDYNLRRQHQFQKTGDDPEAHEKNCPCVVCQERGKGPAYSQGYLSETWPSIDVEETKTKSKKKSKGKKRRASSRVSSKHSNVAREILEKRPSNNTNSTQRKQPTVVVNNSNKAFNNENSGYSLRRTYANSNLDARRQNTDPTQKPSRIPTSWQLRQVPGPNKAVDPQSRLQNSNTQFGSKRSIKINNYQGSQQSSAKDSNLQFSEHQVQSRSKNKTKDQIKSSSPQNLLMQYSKSLLGFNGSKLKSSSVVSQKTSTMSNTSKEVKHTSVSGSSYRSQESSAKKNKAGDLPTSWSKAQSQDSQSSSISKRKITFDKECKSRSSSLESKPRSTISYPRNQTANIGESNSSYSSQESSAQKTQARDLTKSWSKTKSQDSQKNSSQNPVIQCPCTEVGPTKICFFIDRSPVFPVTSSSRLDSKSQNTCNTESSQHLQQISAKDSNRNISQSQQCCACPETEIATKKEVKSSFRCKNSQTNCKKLQYQSKYLSESNNEESMCTVNKIKELNNQTPTSQVPSLGQVPKTFCGFSSKREPTKICERRSCKGSCSRSGTCLFQDTAGETSEENQKPKNEKTRIDKPSCSRSSCKPKDQSPKSGQKRNMDKHFTTISQASVQLSPLGSVLKYPNIYGKCVKNSHLVYPTAPARYGSSDKATLRHNFCKIFRAKQCKSLGAQSIKRKSTKEVKFSKSLFCQNIQASKLEDLQNYPKDNNDPD